MRQLHVQMSPMMKVCHTDIFDNIETANTNAELMSSICVENNVFVVTNSKTSCKHYIGEII